ncbi:MAG: MBL fold metallo-hydrolase [Pyrinomonadaceae bacterium]
MEQLDDSAKVRDAAPKDAAVVILIRPGKTPAQPQVFWARRSERLAFLAGFHAFPGGQRDELDAIVSVLHCDDPERAAMIACAARELFEELGVMTARGAAKFTSGQRASLLDDLQSGRMTFPVLLAHYGLHLDAVDFTFIGRWVTPPFSARRFDTWFFMVECPPKQEPAITDDGELEAGQWIEAGAALARWERGEILTVPPVLHALETLTGGLTPDVVERFLSVAHARREAARRIEFVPGFICFPLRTPTAPPATHTNCYIVGERELIVIDPASPDSNEQLALANCLDELRRANRRVREIILTHHHPDHIGGVAALQAHLGEHVPVAAHRLTAEALAERADFRVTRHIEDNELIHLDGAPPLALRAVHSPGHTRGHLCFYEEGRGVLISGDAVVGLGSVLIDPPEGNMRDYLATLRRLRALPHLFVLLGGHGPAVGNPAAKIDEYLAHRLERERQILAAVGDGLKRPPEIVARVYTDVSLLAHSMAERAVIAHLEKLEAEGIIRRAKESNGQISYLACGEGVAVH